MQNKQNEQRRFESDVSKTKDEVCLEEKEKYRNDDNYHNLFMNGSFDKIKDKIKNEAYLCKKRGNNDKLDDCSSDNSSETEKKDRFSQKQWNYNGSVKTNLFHGKKHNFYYDNSNDYHQNKSKLIDAGKKRNYSLEEIDKGLDGVWENITKSLDRQGLERVSNKLECLSNQEQLTKQQIEKILILSWAIKSRCSKQICYILQHLVNNQTLAQEHISKVLEIVQEHIRYLQKQKQLSRELIKTISYVLSGLAQKQNLTEDHINEILSMLNELDYISKGIKWYTFTNLAEHQRLSKDHIDEILSMLNNNNIEGTYQLKTLKYLSRHQKLSKDHIDKILSLLEELGRSEDKISKSIVVVQILVDEQSLEDSQILRVYKVIESCQNLTTRIVSLSHLISHHELTSKIISGILTIIKNIDSVTEDQFIELLPREQFALKITGFDYKARIQVNCLTILFKYRMENIDETHIDLILDIILAKGKEEYFQNALNTLLKNLKGKFSKEQIDRIVDAISKFEDEYSREYTERILCCTQNLTQEQIEKINNPQTKNDPNQTTSNSITQNKTNIPESKFTKLVYKLLESRNKNSNCTSSKTNKIKESETSTKQQNLADLQNFNSKTHNFDTLLNSRNAENSSNDVKKNVSDNESKKANSDSKKQNIKSTSSINPEISSTPKNGNGSIFINNQVGNSKKESISEKAEGIKSQINADIPKTSKKTNNVL